MPQADTVALPKRLPLVIEPANRQEDTSKDAKLINGYVEKNEKTGEYWIYKRPGLAQSGSTLSGNGYGVYNWQGDIYSIFGNKLYKNGTSIYTGLNTANGVYRFSSSLGATPRLQLGNGVASYNYDSGAGVVAMSGANFPSSCVKGFAYLDGTTYVANATGTATVRGCDSLNDPTAWTDTLNTINVQIEPDFSIAVTKQLVYVIVLKQWSTEVFYDAKNATGSPLGPVQGAKMPYGCVNADSVQEIDGVLLWIATNKSSAAQVIKVENLKPSVISTKPVERLLGEADMSSVYSFGIKYEGHRFYGITLVNENMTLVYDMTDNFWSQWTDSSGNYFPIVSSTWQSNTGRILQHATNGKLYLLDSEYTSDDGSLITLDLFTPNFDGGTRRKKHLNMMEIVGDQTPGSVLQVRCNDEDYAADKWTNFRRIDLGLKRPILPNCGTFRRRAYHFRHQCDTRFRMQGVDLQLDIGVL